MRFSAGWTTDEVVTALNDSPGSLRFNPPPKGVVTRTWVMNRMKSLRAEIRATSSDG